MSIRGGPGRSGATLRVRPHAFGNRRPVLGQRGAAHEQTEVPAIDQLARYVPAEVATRSASAQTSSGGVMWS
jgi:hypothetical protein